MDLNKLLGFTIHSSVVSSFVEIVVIGASILAKARKNANECGNMVVVLFYTSFVKEASFFNRMNYLHGKSIYSQLQCSSFRFLWRPLGTVVNCEKYLAEIYEIVCLSVFYITYTCVSIHIIFINKKSNSNQNIAVYIIWKYYLILFVSN